MTYTEALDYLDSFLNYEQVVTYRYPDDFRLGPIRELLRQLGDPHSLYPTLHVAGTKGKGSTCAFVASILRAFGFRVGLYTSPHLVDFRERIRIDGQPISEEVLAAVVEEIKPFASQRLTFFEITTACAFLCFAKAQVDVAVIEVGMGGRLDATNVLSPSVTAITPISLDHTPQLGDRLTSIALEKAGIIKPHIPVVIAPQESEVYPVLERGASRAQAPYHPVETEVQVSVLKTDIQGSLFHLRTPERAYPLIRISLLGRHQVINAVTAVRMVELFEGKKAQGALASSFDPILEGLSEATWPGRCELIPGDPPILLDGAQNASSAKALRQTVEELFPDKPACLILGVSLGKDLTGIASLLGPWAKDLILTKADVPRAESIFRLAEVFQPWFARPRLTSSVAEALERARALTKQNGLIVITGSLFVVGEALMALKGAFPFASPERASRR